MIMKKLIFIVIALIFVFISCNKANVKKESEFKTPLDSVKYSNYIKLLDFGGGTLNPYVVVTVKNLNTGKTKEVCTTTNFLSGALFYEFGKWNDKKLLSNKQRYFEFKDTTAISNIGFNSYSEKDLEEYKKKIKFDSLIKLNKKGYPYVTFDGNHNELNMYAHLLFNKGIMSTHNSCLCMFQIIDEKYLDERKKRNDELIEMTKKNNNKKQKS